MRRRSLDSRVVSSLVAVALCSGGAVGAQQLQRVERVNVARLLVDARVIDETGQPILGLEAADFEVRIDGQQVAVESAQWIGGELPGTNSLPSVEIAGLVEPTDRGRLIVFLVQKSLQPDRAIGLLRLLQDSERLLAQLTPEDRVAVLSFESHLKLWLDFTDDLDRVRTILTDEVMFRDPGPLEPSRGPSLVTDISHDVGRGTSSIEEALGLIGNALEPLPGSKSVVLIGHGFGELTVTLGIFGAQLDKRYEEARAALDGARAAVFSLDISDVDYHTFEHGLETVSYETGGFFVRTHLFARRAIDQVANALVGHYVLFTEQPAVRDEEPRAHRMEVELVGREGTVLARRTYVD